MNYSHFSKRYMSAKLLKTKLQNFHFNFFKNTQRQHCIKIWGWRNGRNGYAICKNMGSSPIYDQRSISPIIRYLHSIEPQS